MLSPLLKEKLQAVAISEGIEPAVLISSVEQRLRWDPGGFLMQSYWAQMTPRCLAAELRRKLPPTKAHNPFITIPLADVLRS